nr:MAG TPA: hypothetical protein [Bacteriophage sp.]
MIDLMSFYILIQGLYLILASGYPTEVRAFVIVTFIYAIARAERRRSNRS